MCPSLLRLCHWLYSKKPNTWTSLYSFQDLLLLPYCGLFFWSQNRGAGGIGWQEKGLVGERIAGGERRRGTAGCLDGPAASQPASQPDLLFRVEQRMGASGLPLALGIQVGTSIVVSFCTPSHLLLLLSKGTFFALLREALNPLLYQHKARIRAHTSTTMDNPDVVQNH